MIKICLTDLFHCLQRQTTRAGNSKPLKTQVMHTSVVAFQIWAMRALSWLQEVTNKTESLRKLFCHLVMDPQPDEELCTVDKLMLADTMLWKGGYIVVVSARF